MNELLTINDIAHILKISPRTIRNHRTNGTGPAILHQATKPFGNRGGLRWTRQQVDAWTAQLTG